LKLLSNFEDPKKFTNLSLGRIVLKGNLWKFIDCSLFTGKMQSSSDGKEEEIPPAQQKSPDPTPSSSRIRSSRLRELPGKIKNV
jgi:hypothetical protein